MYSQPRKSHKPPLANPAAASAARIIGHGEMAHLIRAFDWKRTVLGPIEIWPDTLVTTVNMLLASRHPMFLWWGPELIQFYNDGYRPSIRADKHPAALGQRGVECWPEIWSIIGPQIESVMNEGSSTWNLNQLIPINRDGKLEEVYWTYGYSPVRDNEATIRATLVVCTDTTDQVLAERRLETLLAATPSEKLDSQHPESQPLLAFAREIVATLRCNPTDIPFAVLYQWNGNEIQCLGSTSSSSDAIDALCPPFLDLARSRNAVIVEDLSERIGTLVCKPWPEPVTRAYVLPFAIHASPGRFVVIFGISPMLPFDDNYKTFFGLIGTRIASLLEREMQRLELVRAAVRFKALSEADPFGMVIGNLQGELKYINPGFLKTLGYSEEEVRSGKIRWDNLTPPEYAAADANAVQQLRTRGRCDVYEKAYLAKDGRAVPILMGASIIDTPEGKAEIAAFVTDLTPLKQAEEALRKANDELEAKVAERTATLEAEIAERKNMEASLRELSGRLLSMRDEERRHMARELHDNAGQTLVALSMNVSAIKTASADADPRIHSLASEAKEFSDALAREIRTMSYLLHPPLLDEVGLESAIRWYVDGFSERSNIKVDLDLPKGADRLPREIELVLFRVVQESLTNVHRHSGSSTARIGLTRSENHLQIEIADRGKGIATEKHRKLTAARLGVGVRGMEERLRQFGGTLQIESSSNGTTVTARLPLDPAQHDL
jgi:PAS domain S-box-containing protein